MVRGFYESDFFDHTHRIERLLLGFANAQRVCLSLSQLQKKSVNI